MQKNAFHGSGTLLSRIILQEVRGDGYDIFLGSPSVGVATKLNLADEKKEQMTIAGQCH